MRRVITSAFFLGLVFSDASEAFGATTPPAAYKRVADTMRATAGRGTREVATRRVAQNTSLNLESSGGAHRLTIAAARGPTAAIPASASDLLFDAKWKLRQSRSSWSRALSYASPRPS